MSLNIELLRSSFVQVGSIADQVADKFYEILFSDYPESKTLFASVNMAKQKKALIGSLSYIVDHLDKGGDLNQYLMKMGERHIKYGTEEIHYPLVGSSLIKTFAFFFGENWTDQLNDAWIEAYGVIAETMISGANREREKQKVVQLSTDFKIELPASIRTEIRQTVAHAVASAVSAEVERALAGEMEKLKCQSDYSSYQKAS